MTDASEAREQWLQQLSLIRRVERRLVSALSAAYRAGLGRWINTGTPDIPVDEKRGIVAALSKAWLDAGIVGGRYVITSDPDAFPGVASDADRLTLFERIMFDFVQRYGATKVQQITETTRDQLVRMIQRGITDGAGQEAIAKQITEAIPTISRTRARVIARTEVHTASIFAGQEVVKTSPYPMNKRWVSVYDARTRDFGEADGEVDQFNHRAMNEVTVGPDELFAVPREGGGFELMSGPGDPNGSAGNVINCRCALIYRRANRPWPKMAEA